MKAFKPVSQDALDGLLGNVNQVGGPAGLVMIEDIAAVVVVNPYLAMDMNHGCACSSVKPILLKQQKGAYGTSLNHVDWFGDIYKV